MTSSNLLCVHLFLSLAPGARIRRASFEQHAAMALLYVALNGSQCIAIAQDDTVRKEWFGQTGEQAMVPVRQSVEAARASHVVAVGEPPACMLCLTMPFHIFYEMVDSGVMLPALHINGYRVYQDRWLDRASGWEWALHPVGRYDH